MILSVYFLPHGMLGSFSASINRNELPFILLHSHCRVVTGYLPLPIIAIPRQSTLLLIFDGISQSGQSLRWGWTDPYGSVPEEQGVRQERTEGWKQLEELCLQMSQRDLWLAWMREAHYPTWPRVECPHLQLLAQCLVLGLNTLKTVILKLS